MAATSSSEAIDLEKQDADEPSCRNEEGGVDFPDSQELGASHRSDGNGNRARTRTRTRNKESLESHDADTDGNGHDDDPQGVLGRALSRATSRSSIDPGPPPDGGWLAWSQCTWLPS